MKDLVKLPFAIKLKLIEKVKERYPDIKERYPEFEGEVPLSWFLTREQIEELIKEVRNESN